MRNPSMLGTGELAIASDTDTIALFTYDPSDEVEPWPIRVNVSDGADSSEAAAYLTLEEAEMFFRKGLAVVERITARRAAA